jgi:hypothetical protein
LFLIDAAYRAKSLQKLIAHDFSDSELYRRFPELKGKTDDEQLFPATVFACFKDVFSYCSGNPALRSASR